MATRKHLATFKRSAGTVAVYLQLFVFAIPVVLGSLPRVTAADLTERSAQVSTARPGNPAVHTFKFNVPSTNPVGSIAFEYCMNSPLVNVTCVPPAGLDLSAVTISNQVGLTGFSLDGASSTANMLVITRPSAAGVVGPAQYEFTDIINPTTAGETEFIRISTYPTENATGPANDRGSVAFALVDAFEVRAFVPPFLTFCVGVFVTLNCNSVTGTKIDVGELQTSQAAAGSLQFSGATNDGSGYTTYVSGYTMTSGNNIVNPLAAPSVSQPGTSQFGLNLRANTSPIVGLDPSGPGSSVPTSGYGTRNSYKFINGDAITHSSVATDFKIFTASYIVNVSPSQPPGIYATTMTFTAVASF